MIAAWDRPHSNRKRRNVTIMTLVATLCLALHALLLGPISGVASRGAGPTGSDTSLQGGLSFQTRHNRNLQNSLGPSDSGQTRAELSPAGPPGNYIDYTDTGAVVNGGGAGRGRAVSGGGAGRERAVFIDDEDMYKAKTRKLAVNSGQDYRTEKGNKTQHIPQAIIIGVKKAGTRALLEYMRMHPNVKAPGPETHFFDKNYKKGLNWYRSQMPEVSSGQTTMEKTPSYFVTKGIPARVYKMAKKTKLIVVLRDPVTRAISDYAQWASRRPDVKPFEEMVFVNNKTRIIDTSWAIIKIGVYAQHLARWLEYFPMKQLHFVSAENLILNPAVEVSAVQKFLGLKQVITHENFTFNETKGFPCYRKFTHTEKWHCLNNEKGRVHPNIDPSVRRRLRDFYRPFNIKLYSMTGIDFGWT